jgi:hypothetical protein
MGPTTLLAVPVLHPELHIHRLLDPDQQRLRSRLLLLLAGSKSLKQSAGIGHSGAREAKLPLLLPLQRELAETLRRALLALGLEAEAVSGRGSSW